MDIKDILLGLTKDQPEFKDDRSVASVRNSLIKTISLDARISGKHSFDDGLILLMTNLAQDEEFKANLDKLAKDILLMFPVEVKEEKTQE